MLSTPFRINKRARALFTLPELRLIATRKSYWQRIPKAITTYRLYLVIRVKLESPLVTLLLFLPRSSVANISLLPLAALDIHRPVS